MKVKDHNKYRYFDYENHQTTTLQLGDIVTKVSEDETEIGVVIQTWNDAEFRTDMFGNFDISEVHLSTMDEIRQFRSELIEDLI